VRLKARSSQKPRAHAKISPVTAGHFIFIPAVMLVGIVIGWILGSRAARDAYLAELRRREQKAQRTPKAEAQSPKPKA